jgi:hypothetical protein
MAGQEIRLQMEPLRTLAFGAIGAGYVAVGTATSHPARQILVQNLTNQTMIFSFDSVNDHFVLPANGFLLDDIASNKSFVSGFYLAQDVVLYAKDAGIAPASGAVYFSVFYGASI